MRLVSSGWGAGNVVELRTVPRPRDAATGWREGVLWGQLPTSAGTAPPPTP